MQLPTADRAQVPADAEIAALLPSPQALAALPHRPPLSLAVGAAGEALSFLMEPHNMPLVFQYK
jgi:hypothetical protein